MVEGFRVQGLRDYCFGRVVKGTEVYSRLVIKGSIGFQRGENDRALNTVDLEYL